jgi:hypothetical protein
MARIMLAGFFGRGNAGDEALLQCAYEAISPHHQVLIGVPPRDAHPQAPGWYPYDSATLVDDSCVGPMLEAGAEALVIGGGGLPPAFAADLALTMRLLGRPTALVGTDNLDLVDQPRVPESLRGYLAGFDFLSLRFRSGVEATRLLGVPAHHGGDWAFALGTSSPEQAVEPRLACICIRFWSKAAHRRLFRFEMHKLLFGLAAQGFAPLLVPFSPEDEVLAEELGTLCAVPVRRMWWNPRAIKGLFARSDLVLSVGRLHPLIFAAPLGVPVCHLAPPLDDPLIQPVGKIEEVTAELCIDRFATVDALLAQAQGIAPASPSAVAMAQARLAESTKRLLAALPGGCAASGHPPEDATAELQPERVRQG